MKEAIHRTNAGVESIEFSIAENLDHCQEKIKEYRKRLEHIGARELLLHGPFLDLNPMSYDSQIQKITKKRFEQAYWAAEELGAKKIIYHSGFLPNVCYITGWAERMADFWNDFLKDKQGIQILMENVFDKTPEPAMEVKKMVDSSDFQLCLDIGHAFCYSSVSVETWIKTWGKAIGHIHLHDNRGSQDEHLKLGSGCLPVSKVLTLLKATVPEATYTIECDTLQAVLESEAIWKKYRNN